MAAINADTVFGDEDPTSPRKIREYIQTVRKVSRAASLALTDDAPMMAQVIIDSPGIPILMGFDLRRKARRLEEPLMEAANAFNAGHNLATLAWTRFYHDFRDVFETAKTPSRGGKKMDWNDV